MAAETFTDFELVQGVVYGPLRSRRYGNSLGINLLPSGVKVCGFNCNYCQLGWTFDLVDHATLAKYRWSTPGEIAAAFRGALEGARAQGESLEGATLSGNGEPTLHPQFSEVCSMLVRTRDEVWSGLVLRALTNGATLDRPDVVEGLNRLDERIVKVDGGNEATFLNMNSPTFPLQLKEVLTGIRRLRDCIVQSMFTRGRRDNTGEKDVADWLEVVRGLAPKKVQIYTLQRRPADAKLQPVPREVLESIAGKARSCGLSAEVF